jgi:SAM-dependent methyltransferase
MSITRAERETWLQFIERNIRVAPQDLDEGIGTVYERVVIDDYFRRLQRSRGIDTVLESPADGVTGVPGINSLEFVRNGGRVWLTNPSQMMLDSALDVWKGLGLVDQAQFSRCPVDDTPFEDGMFDLVWNYCVFERFHDPSPLVREMKRVSRKYVLIMTQNAHNFGTVFHRTYHRLADLEWDHGETRQMTFRAIRRAIREQDLVIEEEGAVDIPPWMDTWDMPLRGVLKEILAAVGRDWDWKIEDSDEVDEEEPSWLMDFLCSLEESLPEWFRRYQAHHLYVLARKA